MKELAVGLSEAQNWTIDRISDMASALGVELVIEARDKVGRVIYTPLDMTEQVAGTSLGWISTGVSTF